MALTTPVDREFQVLPAGYVRDKVVLANFREGLRSLTNPETGQAFTLDEIQRATQPRSRWYVGAQAIDDYGQGEQRKAIWLSDQMRIERASTKWLESFHARLWGEERLPAEGGSGRVTVPGVPGTVILGSPTLGDPSAYTARDAKANIYQVISASSPIGGGGSSVVTMRGVSVGSGTNPPSGELLTWVTRDPNMAAQATVFENFTGGVDQETDGDWASRIAGIIRHRPGSGNDAQVRAWARAVSSAIEDGFVFPCAFYAGSTLISIVQKRGVGVGPLARKPSSGTLADAIGYLTPPLSPVFHPRAFVVVTSWTEQYADIVLQVSLQKASAAGWTDAHPFPAYHATTPQVTSVTSNTDFVISCPGDATLPGQAALATLLASAAPKIMLWDKGTSSFGVCSNVTSITDLGGNLFHVVLASPPGITVAAGQRVSPAMSTSRAAVVAKAIGDYFDGLGPGELFDLDNDSRGGRCVRFVPATEEKPFRAGSLVATRVIDALGGSSADAELASISQTVPTYPTNLMNGPNMLVCGHVGLYEL